MAKAEAEGWLVNIPAPCQTFSLERRRFAVSVYYWIYICPQGQEILVLAKITEMNSFPRKFLKKLKLDGSVPQTDTGG